jgi:hypothetical protein
MGVITFTLTAVVIVYLAKKKERVMMWLRAIRTPLEGSER